MLRCCVVTRSYVERGFGAERAMRLPAVRHVLSTAANDSGGGDTGAGADADAEPPAASHAAARLAGADVAAAVASEVHGAVVLAMPMLQQLLTAGVCREQEPSRARLSSMAGADGVAEGGGNGAHSQRWAGGSQLALDDGNPCQWRGLVDKVSADAFPPATSPPTATANAAPSHTPTKSLGTAVLVATRLLSHLSTAAASAVPRPLLCALPPRQRSNGARRARSRSRGRSADVVVAPTANSRAGGVEQRPPREKRGHGEVTIAGGGNTGRGGGEGSSGGVAGPDDKRRRLRSLDDGSAPLFVPLEPIDADGGASNGDDSDDDGGLVDDVGSEAGSVIELLSDEDSSSADEVMLVADETGSQHDHAMAQTRAELDVASTIIASSPASTRPPSSGRYFRRRGSTRGTNKAPPVRFFNS